MKNQDIEIRALIKDTDRSLVCKKIIDSGAISKVTRHIHDIYYCDQSCQSVEDVEMNKVGSYSIRIRKEVKDETT